MDIKRYNFETTHNGISVCYGDHDKSDDCEYEDLTPKETLELIEKMRAEIIQLRNQIDKGNDMESHEYMEVDEELRKAWFEYRKNAKSIGQLSVKSFVAGWNAYKKINTTELGVDKT